MVMLLLTDRQAETLARVAADPTVEAAIADQLRVSRLFTGLDDAPTTILLHRRPLDGKLVYAAVTYGTPEAADRAWRRKVGLRMLT